MNLLVLEPSYRPPYKPVNYGNVRQVAGAGNIRADYTLQTVYKNAKAMFN